MYPKIPHSKLILNDYKRPITLAYLDLRKILDGYCYPGKDQHQVMKNYLARPGKPQNEIIYIPGNYDVILIYRIINIGFINFCGNQIITSLSIETCRCLKRTHDNFPILYTTRLNMYNLLWKVRPVGSCPKLQLIINNLIFTFYTFGILKKAVVFKRLPADLLNELYSYIC